MRPATRFPLLLVSLLMAAPSSLAHPGIAPGPHGGDAALYDATLDTGGGTHRLKILLEWVSADVELPSGLARAVPTLRTTLLDANGAEIDPSAPAGARLGLPVPGPDLAMLNPTKDYTNRAPPYVQQREAHLAGIPGDVIAETMTWWDGQGEDTPRGEWVHRTMLERACDPARIETVLARLAGTTAGAGRDEAIRGCGGSTEAGLIVFSQGTTTLVVQGAGSDGLPSGFSQTVQTSAGRSTLVATLVGRSHGGAPLPRAAAMPPSPPALPLVDWSAAGPEEGDLASHPLRGAVASLTTQSSDAAAFFRAHPDAGLLVATHVWGQPLPLSSDASGFDGRVKSVRCAPDPVAAQPGQTNEWSLAWAAPRAGLFAVTQQVSAGPLGVSLPDRVIAESSQEHGSANFPDSSNAAPSPTELAARLHDLDRVQPQGIDSIDYQFASDDPASPALAGVSRGVCTRDAAGDVDYEGSSLWFTAGRPSILLHASIRRQTAGIASLPPLLGDPAPARSGAGSIPAGLAMTGALVLGSAAVLVTPRVVESLYSRIGTSRALDHPKRAQLLAAARAAPGSTLPELATILGMPRNTLEHHARVLARLGYVRTVRTTEGTAIYPTESALAPYAHVLARAHASEVLAHVRTHPGVSQTEIVAAFGLRKSHASTLLRDLERAGLVVRTREGRELRVRGTPLAARIA
jgi:DNA-binding MarR family transcriptional regulator